MHHWMLRKMSLWTKLSIQQTFVSFVNEKNIWNKYDSDVYRKTLSAMKKAWGKCMLKSPFRCDSIFQTKKNGAEYANPSLIFNETFSTLQLFLDSSLWFAYNASTFQQQQKSSYLFLGVIKKREMYIICRTELNYRHGTEWNGWNQQRGSNAWMCLISYDTIRE